MNLTVELHALRTKQLKKLILQIFTTSKIILNGKNHSYSLISSVWRYCGQFVTRYMDPT